MKIIVVGCGSIGQRHLRNLAALGVEEITVCDPDEARRQLAASLLSQIRARCPAPSVHADLGQALREVPGVNAAFICTPSSLHLEQALAAAEAGLDLFVEKPLAHEMEGVSDLLSLVRKRGLILMVGMCYRFHPGLRSLKRAIDEGEIGRVLTADMWAGSYLPRWHPHSDYRKEYSARRDLGGGVVLDSIHSFDSLRWLFGEPAEIACRATRVSDLEIDTEDLAAAIVVMESGAVVQLHVDYLQQPGSSRIEVVGSRGKAVWDASAGTVEIYRAGSSSWQKTPYVFDVNDMYVAEAAQFIECVRSRGAPHTDGESGLETLRLALAAKEASRRGCFLPLALPLEGTPVWGSAQGMRGGLPK